MFNSLKFKVLLVFSVSTLFILSLLVYSLYYFIESNTKLTIENNLYNKAVIINKRIISNRGEKIFDDNELKGIEGAIIYENKIIYTKGTRNFNAYQHLIKEKDKFFIFDDEKGNVDGLYILRIDKPFNGSILFYQKNVDKEIQEEIGEIKKILLFILPLIFALFLFSAEYIINKIFKNIRKITETANSIYINKLDTEIETLVEDNELSKLTNSFNNMLKRLREGTKDLENFNNNVSHELKTPITIIKGEIELSKKNENITLTQYKNTINSIEEEIDNITVIIDELLLLTQYNVNNVKDNFDLIPLHLLIEEVVEKMNIKYNNNNITIFTSLNSCFVECNEVLVNSLFLNIIDNSLKYSSTERENIVEISLLENEENIVFVINDTGIGISNINLKNIHKRFFRGDKSRNKNIQGYGLGLSIVEKSIKLHNWKYFITSVEGEGTKTEVIIPKNTTLS